MRRSKADSFTAFLEEKQRLRSSAPAAIAPASQGSTPLSLLFKLAEARKPEMKLSDLQAASGMPFTTFAETLKSLGDSGYVPKPPKTKTSPRLRRGWMQATAFSLPRSGDGEIFLLTSSFIG